MYAITRRCYPGAQAIPSQPYRASQHVRLLRDVREAVELLLADCGEPYLTVTHPSWPEGACVTLYIGRGGHVMAYLSGFRDPCTAPHDAHAAVQIASSWTLTSTQRFA